MSESAIYPYPEHWKLTTLGELCKESGGGIQTGPFGSQLHASDYVDVGIPSIMPKNISIEGVSTEDIARITEQDAQRLSKYLVKAGDIVYSRRGDVEKCSLITEKENGWLCGTGCLKVSFGQKSKIPSEYIHAYLSHPLVREWISRHAVGATMPNLNTSILSDVPVLIPSEDEIDVILNVWKNTTDKIILNRQTSQTLEHIAQAIFKSWFVDFDPTRAKIAAKQAGQDPERAAMAVISGKALDELDQLSSAQLEQLKTTAGLFPDALVDSELGEIPEGWEVKPLDEIAENHSTTFDFSKVDEVVFVNTGDVLEGRFLHKNYSSKVGLPGQAKKTIKKDDILYSEIRPKNKRFAYVTEECDDYVVSTKFMIIRSLGYVHPRYLYQILRQELIIQEFNLIAESRSGTFPQITFAAIGHTPVVVPTKDMQEVFMAFFAPIIEKIDVAVKEEKSLTELRDTLLPKLLSGELSVKEEKSLTELRDTLLPKLLSGELSVNLAEAV